jgi:hypothetical protein
MTDPTDENATTVELPDTYRTRIIAAWIIGILAVVALGWLVLSSPTQELSDGSLTCTPLIVDSSRLSTVDTDLTSEVVFTGQPGSLEEVYFSKLELQADLIARCAALQQSRLTQVTLVSVIGATTILLLVLAPRQDLRGVRVPRQPR